MVCWLLVIFIIRSSLSLRESINSSLSITAFHSPNCRTIPHWDYIPHDFTARGLRALDNIFPKQYFDLERILLDNPKATVLDYGCGSGRSLLQIQERLPNGSTYCINKSGYRHSQSENVLDLIDVAFHYKIRIHCNETHYLLPRVVLTIGLAEETAIYQSLRGKFDFIYSMHALNFGKVSIVQSHLWVELLVPLLRAAPTSRMAMLLNEVPAVDVYAFANRSLSQREAPIKTWRYCKEEQLVSITLFIAFIQAERFKPYLSAIVQKSTCEHDILPAMIVEVEHEAFEFISLLRMYKLSHYGTEAIREYNQLTIDERRRPSLFVHRYSVQYAWNLLEHLDSMERRFPGANSDVASRP